MSTCTYVLVRIIHGEYKEIVFPSIQFSILRAWNLKVSRNQSGMKQKAETGSGLGFRESRTCSFRGLGPSGFLETTRSDDRCNRALGLL